MDMWATPCFVTLWIYNPYTIQLIPFKVYNSEAQEVEHWINLWALKHEMLSSSLGITCASDALVLSHK